MLKSIEQRKNRIKCFEDKIKKLNEINEPSFFNDVFQEKKEEEHKEVLEAVEVLTKAINELHKEIADNIITKRDNCTFDFRIECTKAISKYGLFELIKLLSSEDEILKACHEKIDRTIMRIESGYYEKI